MPKKMPADEAAAAPAELGDFPEEVRTPVGWPCAECDRPIEEGDRGRRHRMGDG
jgi:hypothetical protein